TLKELGALDKPTLVVFNKVDVLEERGLIASLRAEYEHAAFVSALRGIGLDRLRAQLLALIESDYVEREALLPVAEAKSYAYLRSVAEVLDEQTLLADDYGETVPVLRIRYRASSKNAPELARMLARFAHLVPAEPGGDGALEGVAPYGERSVSSPVEGT